MNTFRKICAAVTVLFVLLTVALNYVLFSRNMGPSGLYRVEAKRAAEDMAETGSCDLSQYPHIKGVYSGEDLYHTDEQYLIVETGGTLYRVEYNSGLDKTAVAAVNIVLLILFLLVTGLLLYVRKHIIVPFGRLNDVPNELARGNLAVDIPEEKSRFFGKFTWGVNLLKEKIEQDRQRELSMQRDKKLLLLSLSHDIKTPLFAIKLNSKALAKGLYQEEEKRLHAAESIDKRVNEIEAYVNQITKAAGEDFMEFEVNVGEVFLSDVVERVAARYAPQLSASSTAFDIGSYDNCLLSCDADRLGECLQNLIENAVKYGDGREIRLSFDRMDGCELITVANTGCSLEEKELTQIFESFHRGTNADNIRGNGLGLFICKRLMSLMGGEVFAEIKNGEFMATLVVRMV